MSLRLIRTISLVSLLGASLLTSCGTPGIPLPPSLELPNPVADLHAKRKGDKVYLTWTAPARTTDRQPIRHFGPTRICRRAGLLETCGAAITEVPTVPPKIPAKNPTPQPQSYTDTLPQSALMNPSANLTYAVEVMNDRGRSAGLSNKVQVPAAPTLPPPANFAAEVTADGVVLSWVPVSNPGEISGLHYLYRIYRREENSKTETVAGELQLDSTPNPGFVDHNLEWEKKYLYHADVVTLVAGKPGSETKVEGDDTPEAAVFTHDIFPPAVPSGLQAVFSSENEKLFVDLIWNPNTESDLAGYNIFRHEEGGSSIKINSELVKLPAFRDLNVSSGKKYYYSVSAVDVRGNESARSEEANEIVP
ncbi:MAG: hypothetical protein ACHP8A_10115 [Terriglobales bacterium]